MLASFVFALIQTQAPSELAVDYASRSGLTISLRGIPIVRGSWFQYYEPGWTKGYYSSSWNDQVITRESPTKWTVKFRSNDGLAHGNIDVEQNDNTVGVYYRLRWDGPKQANVELCAAMLWAPWFTQSDNQSFGNAGRSLESVPSLSDTVEKRLINKGNDWSFQNGQGNVTFSANQTTYDLFDGRNYDQDWARGKQLFWLGSSAIPIPAKGEWSGRTIFRVQPSEARSVSASSFDVVANGAPAKLPSEGPLPLVPQPKSAKLDTNQAVSLTSFDIGSERFGIASALNKSLTRRFGKKLPTRKDGQVFASLRSTLKPGGYSIAIGTRRIDIYASNAEGFQNAAHTLGLLAYSKSGKLSVPSGSIEDWPSTSWRGVHLFVGPTAPEFQRRLWESVLRPLKLNQVVLQCERTDWTSQPDIKTSITMPRSGLSRLGAMYKELGVEVTPLIQSFGHMEWLMANNQNADLAFNPNVLYSIDPRKPRSEKVLRDIWSECISILKPRIIHFGLDEVNMRGWPDDHSLVTDLWALQLPILNSIAQDHKVASMIWGDMGLAPGEAIDAMNGDTKEHAARRRKAIPKGTYIADWHYRNDPKPDGFKKSLRIWKEGGHLPIASAWYRTHNIKGFAHAAIEEGAGFLQTTWAGYESNEANMLREIQQFTAMILAAEYSWSGRKELPSELPYDATSLFRRLYFEPGDDESLIQRYRPAQTTTNLHVPSIMSSASEGKTGLTLRFSRAGSPGEMKASILGKGYVYLWLATDVVGDENSPAVSVTFNKSGQVLPVTKLQYGTDIRALNDPMPIVRRRRDANLGAIIRIPVSAGVDSCTLTMVNPALGLRVLGMGWSPG